MKQSRDGHAQLIDADLGFHRTIFRMADNRVCTVMFSIVHQYLHSLMEITSQMVGLEYTVRLHTRIYTAIRKRDSAEARPRMAAHLMDAKGLLLRSRDAQIRARLGDRLAKLSHAVPSGLLGAADEQKKNRRHGMSPGV